jgi:hypothetical protein
MQSLIVVTNSRNFVYYALKTQFHINLHEHICDPPPLFYRPMYRVFLFFCENVSRTYIEYLTQSAERHVGILVITISTCRKPFVRRLWFRSPNGFHCSVNLMLPRTAFSHDMLRTADIHNSCWTMLTATSSSFLPLPSISSSHCQLAYFSYLIHRVCISCNLEQGFWIWRI